MNDTREILKKKWHESYPWIIKGNYCCSHNEGEFTREINVNIYIEDNLTQENQDYVVGLRFFNFGSFADIYLISTNSNEKTILRKHMKNLGWDTHFDSCLSPAFDKCILPFIITSGSLMIDECSKVHLLSGENSSVVSKKLATYILSIIDNSYLDHINDKSGFVFIKDLQNFMEKKFRHEDFYESFLDEFYKQYFDVKVDPQHSGALIAMKAFDISSKESKDFWPIWKIQNLKQTENK